LPVSSEPISFSIPRARAASIVTISSKGSRRQLRHDAFELLSSSSDHSAGGAQTVEQ
jgi:hypothetical protein